MIRKDRPAVHYGDYLQLNKILNAQQPESSKEGIVANDEMLFIIIHQTYELWFKQILFELNVIRDIFLQEDIPNNSPDIYNTVHRIKRVCAILQIAVDQMGIMETMTPLDFLDFRDLLRPASGFQSIQFKIVEATLGLTFEKRHGHGYYLSQLRPEEVELVKEAESKQSLLSLVNKWLERMPFIKDDNYWKTTENTSFWSQYRSAYDASLYDAEKNNLVVFDKLFMNDTEYARDRALSADASRNALFIMIYRDYPLLHLPYELLSSLLEIDELLSLWRHRHIHMVQRTIGKRIGTGGSTGADYLQKAADSHYIFKELAELTSFLMPRSDLPKLPEALVADLSFQR